MSTGVKRGEMRVVDVLAGRKSSDAARSLGLCRHPQTSANPRPNGVLLGGSP